MKNKVPKYKLKKFQNKRNRKKEMSRKEDYFFTLMIRIVIIIKKTDENEIRHAPGEPLLLLPRPSTPPPFRTLVASKSYNFVSKKDTG